MYTNKRRAEEANYSINSFSFEDVDGKTYRQVNIKTEGFVQTNYFKTNQEADKFIAEVDNEVFQGRL